MAAWNRPDVLFRGGPIFGAPGADALAVGASRIIAIGQSAVLGPLAHAHTQVLELDGRPVLPGFVDAHVHLDAYARSRLEPRLEGVRSIDEALGLVAERVEKTAPGSWITGRGWLLDELGRWPTATDLDAVAPDHPVALASHDHHALWVNTAALRAAGVCEGAPDPPGGVILKRDGGSGKGQPSGVLLEAAQALIYRVVPEPAPEERAARLAEVIAEANRAGLVGIHDFEGSDAYQAFSTLRERGQLSLRVTMGTTAQALARDDWSGLFGGDGDLRISLVKLYSDGALGSRTAFMLAPYEGSDQRGIQRLGRAEILALTRRARARGLGVAVHAIGDGATRVVLDAFGCARADASSAARRQILRLEHAQLLHPDDLPRLSRLNIIASMQPNHCPADRTVAEKEWGPRCALAYAWRSVVESGAVLALGTDCPVESLEPLENIFAAVTRQALAGAPAGGWYPEQRLTLDQAICAYTLGSAMASGDAATRGALEVGKLADLVVLSRPISDREPATLLETQVDLTMVGGRVVFERG